MANYEKKTNSFIIYSASVMFLRSRDNFFNHYPVMATEYCYQSLESFMDFCEISARQNEDFAKCDVFINCSVVRILEDGTLEKIDGNIRSFRNQSK